MEIPRLSGVGHDSHHYVNGGWHSFTTLPEVNTDINIDTASCNSSSATPQNNHSQLVFASSVVVSILLLFLLSGGSFFSLSLHLFLLDGVACLILQHAQITFATGVLL
jgi:hypothetical protein